MQRRSLRSNSAWSLLGTIVYMGSQWGILILLAKLGSARMVGQVALALAISAPVFFLTNLGLRQVLATDRRAEHSVRDYVKTRLWTALVGWLITVSLGGLFASDREALYVVVWIAVAKLFEACSDLCYGFFQRAERLDRVGQSNSTRGLAAFGMVALGLINGLGAVSAAIGWAVGWGLVLLVFDLPLARRALTVEGAEISASDEAMPTKGGWQLVREALPLGIAGMWVMLNLNMPRYWLSHSHGEAALGIFAAAAYLPLGGRRVLEAIGQAATPRMARYWAEGEWGAYRKLLLQLLVIGFAALTAGLIVVAIFGAEILRLLYTEEYAAHATVFTWLMLSWGLRYPGSFLTSGIIAARRFRLVAWAHFPSLLAAVTFGALLIPRYGLIGAAWADMISASIQLVLTLFVAQRVYSRRGQPA